MNTLGELERSVMDQLWSSPEAQSVRDVHLALTRNRDLAYTTVMTVLDRLAKKGLVRRERDGRAYLYVPKQTREQLVAEVMHTALDGDQANRTAALVAFVGKVSPAEAEAMRQALAELESQQPKLDPSDR
jgi:predicted transcriptional regulator